MGFSRQKYWSVLPLPSPRDLPNSGIETWSPALAGGFFATEPPGKPHISAVLFLLQSTFILIYRLAHTHQPCKDYINQGLRIFYVEPLSSNGLCSNYSALPCGMKAALGNGLMNECGCVLIKLYL